MTLQRKFALLMALVAMAVGVIAGTSLWSIGVLQEEVASPLVSLQTVLGGLHRVQVDATRIGDSLAGTAASPSAELEARIGAIGSQLDRLEREETYLVRSGISTTRAIRQAARNLDQSYRRWASSGDESARQEALGTIATMNGLIEGVHVRALGDMTLAAGHAADVRRLAIFSVVVAAASVGLAGWLGAMLVRRWIVRPVRRLREAASRFGAGDLAYRLPVDGNDELSQLSAEVNAMAATIASMQEERIERERLAAVGEMVRRIAHNIRNPLAGIRSLAELTRADVAGGSELAENQDRIVATVDRFVGWVEQLLTATAPLNVVPAPAEVRPWARAMVELRRAAAERMGVRLTLVDDNAPEVAPFDARHLEQAVGAIIDNAIGVTPGGGEVRVEVASGDGVWTITVHDGGPGIPEGLRDRIFAPYFTTRRDGTGLGLAMARQVVEQHAGRIEVESTDDGALFRVVIPAGKAARVPTDAAPTTKR